jgi:predicted N-acetyltransferase YhbS
VAVTYGVMPDSFGLPRLVEDGLTLRWATLEDADALAAFNVRLHSEDFERDPEHWVELWTRDLMSGRHPTTSAGDFTIVADRNGQIVSSAVLISQTWAYEDVEFGCGRPELVGTATEYQRRGLVRSQFEAIHAKSMARGEMVQAITGIPWYYRRFGYEMALDLGGSRRLDLDKIKPLPEAKDERYRLRRAGVEDRAVLSELYDIHTSRSLVKCVRDEALWKYELEVESSRYFNLRSLMVIEEPDGKVAGYTDLSFIPNSPFVRELGVLSGVSLRAVATSLARHVKSQLASDVDLKAKNAAALIFQLGVDHPVYDALESDLDPPRRPYAWYLRVADIAAFVQQIAPVLQTRLSGSVMAGHTGELKLNFYQSQLCLRFESGCLVGVKPYEPDGFFDGHAFFPDLTFLQLLFGYRSRQELEQARSDVFVSDVEMGILVDALFPRRPSCVSPVA